MREKVKELKTALEEFKRLVDMFSKAKREDDINHYKQEHIPQRKNFLTHQTIL